MCFCFFQWQIGFVAFDHLIGFAPYSRLIGVNRIFTILSNPIEGKSPTPIEPIYWRLLSYPIKLTPTHYISTNYPLPKKIGEGCISPSLFRLLSLFCVITMANIATFCAKNKKEAKKQKKARKNYFLFW